MKDMKKIATRESYGNALKELMDEHQDVIVFDVDLSNATKTNIAQKAHPDCHINCGIVEGNMMAVAAGAAAMGLVPFASSFAMFVAGRAFEQVRNSVDYPPSECEDRRHPRRHLGEVGAVRLNYNSVNNEKP